jgi:hypothetical protein
MVGFLRHDLFDDLTVDVGEAAVDAGMRIASVMARGFEFQFDSSLFGIDHFAESN